MLSSGKILYHGPRELVLPFFESQGFVCPPKKGAADFLQEVPTLAGKRRQGREACAQPSNVCRHLGSGLETRPLRAEKWLISGAEHARSRPCPLGALPPAVLPSPWCPRHACGGTLDAHHPHLWLCVRRSAVTGAGVPPCTAPPADQRKYWAGEPSAYQFVSSQAFSDACWTQTEAGRAAAAELAAPFDASVTKDWDEDPLQRTL